MADEFRIIPYQVRSAGTDVPPEEVQAAINSLAQQVTVDLNILSTQSETPTGPAGGDLGGTYPNPTVVNLHVTGGTETGVAVTGNTINSSPIGQTTPAAGSFTTVTATTPIGIASGGTGSGTAGGARTNLGLGTIATQNANSVAITGGTIDNTPIGQTTTAAGSFTTLSSTGGALNGSLGATTPNTVAATTLSASSTVSGAGFTARFASPGPIGNTAASTGAFTTITASSTITPSSTAGIVGTTTNDNANAGSVGEYIPATGTNVGVTNATPTNITSVSLTAGDWEVHASLSFIPAGTTTVTQVVGGLNTASATLPGNPFTWNLQTNAGVLTTGGGQSGTVPSQRLSLAGTTTVFLVAQSSFAVSTMAATGIIRARRVR